MESIIPLILTYRYWILIPLTFVEGPIVAFIAGTLAAAGYFDVYFLAFLFLAREVVMDGMYYAIGHFSGKTLFVRRLLQKIGVNAEHLEDVRVLWEKHPGRTMFIGKISYGIALSFIVLAGAVGMRLSLFFAYGISVAVLQYGTLLLLGYFFGNAFGGNIFKILQNIQYFIAAIALIGVVYYLFDRRTKNKIKTNTLV